MGANGATVDCRGRFLQAVEDGRQQTAKWVSGRIIVGNRQIILAADAGKRRIAASQITAVGGRYDHAQAIARVSDYLAIEYTGNDVILLAPEPDFESFQLRFTQAALGEALLEIRHPAVEGGVVTDATWVDGKVRVTDGAVQIATRDAQFIEIEVTDVSRFETAQQTVDGESQTVLQVRHTESDGTAVQTDITGETWKTALIGAFIERGFEATQTEIDLSGAEEQVLMALQSGVSPFEIPSFVGMEVDRVEEIYDRLVELDVLRTVRTRKEVELTARGRNIASGAVESE